jgi:hypothetical protein
MSADGTKPTKSITAAMSANVLWAASPSLVLGGIDMQLAP